IESHFNKVVLLYGKVKKKGVGHVAFWTQLNGESKAASSDINAKTAGFFLPVRIHRWLSPTNFYGLKSGLSASKHWSSWLFSQGTVKVPSSGCSKAI
ncbi:MAG: hypothetical protein ABJH96_12550, partial [Algoriphagus sp.]|uniref:hypothetical protein n=1 Tax=Algoriphagus sp. TaxID=1872435 RepID=UPI0032992A8F